MHPGAPLLHRAALAAAEQGRFWEMHDLIFANPSAATRDDVTRHATKLGLDLARFVKDLDAERLGKVIEADMADGAKRGVNGTPTFFINGTSYSGARTLDQLKQLVVTERRRAVAMAEITDEMMSKGPADAPVTLEIFADLQSPVSRPAIDAAEEVLRRYPDSVRLQFRNFPLAFHPLAGLAHEAAMTAARDGRFWEFTAYLLDHEESLREQDVIAHAARIGLDEHRFADVIRERRYAPRVNADVQVGFQRGIRGSPAILVNGRRIDGVPSLGTLTAYVDAALAAARASR
jgi:protein-disulfide isomerase